MKALVYLGAGKKALQDVAAPKLQDATDAIVRMTHTTICGSDLHILKGDVPEVTPGRVLGHEGVGLVESARPAVSAIIGGAEDTGALRPPTGSRGSDNPFRIELRHACFARPNPARHGRLA